MFVTLAWMSINLAIILAAAGRPLANLTIRVVAGPVRFVREYGRIVCAALYFGREEADAELIRG